MSRSTRLAALLSAVFAVSPVFGAQGFAPGEWQHQTQLLEADVPGIPQWLIKLTAGHGSRKNCNSPALAQSHPEVLMQGDPSASCRLRKLSMTNGKLAFDTFCTNKHFPDGLLVSSRGSYTPTSYFISTTSTGSKDGKPVRILTTGTGKRIANSCGKS